MVLINVYPKQNGFFFVCLKFDLEMMKLLLLKSNLIRFKEQDLWRISVIVAAKVFFLCPNNKVRRF